MLNGFISPASDTQKFINRVANADIGDVLIDPQGRSIEKVGYVSLKVDGELTLDEDYFATLRVPAVGGKTQSE